MTEAPPDIFDRRRRLVRRAIRRGPDFFGDQITEALLERLSLVTRPFANALVIGARSPDLVTALAAGAISVDIAEPADGTGLAADSDHLDVPPGRYDLVVWPGGLDSVNDVPGALLRARFALRPDGLLLGALVGDGSFPVLRAALREGAIAAGRPMAARMHPQISLQAMGALLQRTGLALPVVDVDVLNLRYRDIGGLVRDVRANALTALLAGPLAPMHRDEWAGAAAAFRAAGDQSGTLEAVRIMHFSGWAPDASQPRPARRGSATTSLAAALGVRHQPNS